MNETCVENTFLMKYTPSNPHTVINRCQTFVSQKDSKYLKFTSKIAVLKIV